MYQDRVIVFIDILGFKEIIDSTVGSDGKQDRKKVKEIKHLLSLPGDMLKDHPGVVKSKVVSRFSDSIIISFKYSEPSQVFYTILDVLHLHIEFLNLGYLIRGGITHGKLHHSKKMIFGPGLVRAYEFESQQAKFPRVIIDSKVFEIGVKNAVEGHSDDIELEHLMNVTRKDDDGMFYVEYLENAFSEIDDAEFRFPLYIQKMRQVIEVGLKHSKPSVVEKYEWLRKRFNELIDQIEENKYAERIVDELDEEMVDFYRRLTKI